MTAATVDIDHAPAGHADDHSHHATATGLSNEKVVRVLFINIGVCNFSMTDYIVFT